MPATISRSPMHLPPPSTYHLKFPEHPIDPRFWVKGNGIRSLSRLGLQFVGHILVGQSWGNGILMGTHG